MRKTASENDSQKEQKEMKKTSAIKKVCSTILCVVLVLNVLIGAMLAVSAASQITAVSISGIDVPRPGQTPDYTAIGAGVYYPSLEFESSLKNGVSWSDVTNSNDRKILKPTDKFEAGHKYEISIVLEAAEGYEFAIDKNFDWTVTARINGLTAKTYAFTGIDKRKNMGVRYTFTCASERIDSVAVNGINMPVAGTKAADLQDGAVVDANAPYYIISNPAVYWSEVINAETDDTRQATVFEAGKTYRAQIAIRTKTGYKLKTDADGVPNPTVTVNGKTAQIVYAESEIAMEVYYDFVVPEDITFVSVSGIDAPVAGKTADTSAVVDGTGYKITNIEWWDVTVMAERKKVTSFEAGRKYDVCVDLQTVDNYRFYCDERDYDIQAINAKINGKDATAYSSYSDTEATIGYAFYTPLEHVDITGITPPVIGTKPDMTAETADDKYEVSSVLWYELDENGVAMLPALNAEYVFEEGKQYRVSVVVSAVSPYKFFCDPEDSNIQAVTATLNGKQAHVYSSYSWTKADVAYTFDKLTKLDHVDITGITAPVIGAKPDMTAETADERCEVSSVLWYELDENGVSMLPALNADSVFEEGKQYRVAIVVSAISPYKFFCDPANSNVQAVTANLNGKQAHVNSSYSWTKADVSYTFDKLTNAVEDRLIFKADSAFSADHEAKIAVLSLRQTAEQVSAQIANEYFDVKANPSADFVGTGSVITVKDKDGNTLSQYTVLVKFDVNGDGKVEPADARLALRAAVNLESYDGVQKMAADTNADGKIEPSDARVILRKAVGLN